MNFEELIEDVHAGRRSVQKISDSCQGNPAILVLFNDGLEISVSDSQAGQLLDANKTSQVAKLKFDHLIAVLDWREK